MSIARLKLTLLNEKALFFNSKDLSMLIRLLSSQLRSKFRPIDELITFGYGNVEKIYPMPRKNNELKRVWLNYTWGQNFKHLRICKYDPNMKANITGLEAQS